ncbi:hypothetical protein HK105_203839 [Polyrhizophydium stewartii]|uniref:Peptidase A1 domain-containing protein n=1 Tax=Polyrhizophydium stewartii TaxID=2732419 RepID=A0ABR4NB15_9FUNG
MFGPSDPCAPAYAACLAHFGSGFISTLAFADVSFPAGSGSMPAVACGGKGGSATTSMSPSLTDPATSSAWATLWTSAVSPASSTAQPSPSPSPPGQACGSGTPPGGGTQTGVCSSMCYSCGAVLADTGASTTWLSPDASCETLRYACRLACGGGDGWSVPLCLANYFANATTPSAGSIGTCVCRSLAEPRIELPRAVGASGVRICSGARNSRAEAPNPRAAAASAAAVVAASVVAAVLLA